jgi:hypothetical protein
MNSILFIMCVVFYPYITHAAPTPQVQLRAEQRISPLRMSCPKISYPLFSRDDTLERAETLIRSVLAACDGLEPK